MQNRVILFDEVGAVAIREPHERPCEHLAQMVRSSSPGTRARGRPHASHSAARMPSFHLRLSS
jgi:hypothetical protein